MQKNIAARCAVVMLIITLLSGCFVAEILAKYADTYGTSIASREPVATEPAAL